jgi:hypothetical protein
MKRFLQIILLVAPAFFVAACGPRGPKATDPLPVEQMRIAFQKAFQSADAATREMVDKFVDEAEKHQVADAYADVNDLMAMHNMTQEQVTTVVRAADTMGKLAADAAQNGDQQVADAIHSALRRH